MSESLSMYGTFEDFIAVSFESSPTSFSTTSETGKVHQEIIDTPFREISLDKTVISASLSHTVNGSGDSHRYAVKVVDLQEVRRPGRDSVSLEVTFNVLVRGGPHTQLVKFNIFGIIAKA